MPASAPAACVLHFDIFELDLRAGELRKSGVKLRLQGQPLQVLAILLQRAGNLVTREELRSQLWPADTFVDFDHSLHNAIARLREVLGCAVALASWVAWQHFHVQVSVTPIRSLAVLPLQNLSGDAAQEYFADGMTEELITELSR